MNYFLLGGGWVVYFALHSILASERTKKAASRILKTGYRYYRLFYNLIATLGLLALLILNGKLESPYYFERYGLVRYISVVFITFGVMTIQLAFREYRLKAFIGLAEEESKLKIDGILKWIRHPIYSGLILVTIGFFLFIPNLASVVTSMCIFAYLPLGIYFEEKKLIAHFGQKYQDYREQVPALVPRLSALFRS